MSTIEEAREALNGQWNRHIGGLHGGAREITAAVDDLISARFADRDRCAAVMLGVAPASGDMRKPEEGETPAPGSWEDIVAGLKERDDRIADLERRLAVAESQRAENYKIASTYIKHEKARRDERDAARATIAEQEARIDRAVKVLLGSKPGHEAGAMVCAVSLLSPAPTDKAEG